MNIFCFPDWSFLSADILKIKIQKAEEDAALSTQLTSSLRTAECYLAVNSPVKSSFKATALTLWLGKKNAPFSLKQNVSNQNNWPAATPSPQQSPHSSWWCSRWWWSRHQSLLETQRWCPRAPHWHWWAEPSHLHLGQGPHHFLLEHLLSEVHHLQFPPLRSDAVTFSMKLINCEIIPWFNRLKEYQC